MLQSLTVATLFNWFAKRFRELDLLRDYFSSIATHWQAALWGASVPAVVWGLWFIIGAPPAWVNWTAVTAALFLASYYVWRADHVRLIPKFEVRDIKFQSTPTVNVATGQDSGSSVWVQLLPKCLSDAPVHDCAGHLKRVHRWSIDTRAWQETEMNESVPLGWSHGDEKHTPITLEPDNERRLNVFSIHSQSKWAIIPIVYPLPLRYQLAFRGFDTGVVFRFDITIRGKDCAPVDVYLRVKRGDEWDRPIVEFVSQVQEGYDNILIAD